MRERVLGYLIGSLTAGGAERVVSMLANEISTNKKVIVITLTKDLPHYFLNDHIQLIQLGVTNNSNNLLKVISSNINFISKLIHY